jgi:hypothetical protein
VEVLSPLCPALRGTSPKFRQSRFVVQEAYDTHYDKFDILIDAQEMKAYKLISGQFQHRLVWLAEP